MDVVLSGTGRCFLAVLGFIQQRWFQQEHGARHSEQSVSLWASAVTQDLSVTLFSLIFEARCFRADWKLITLQCSLDNKVNLIVAQG